MIKIELVIATHKNGEWHFLLTPDEYGRRCFPRGEIDGCPFEAARNYLKELVGIQAKNRNGLDGWLTLNLIDARWRGDGVVITYAVVIPSIFELVTVKPGDWVGLSQASQLEQATIDDLERVGGLLQ